MRLVVGIDMATAEVRATAVDADGVPHAIGRAPLPAPTTPQAGWSEQDAASWWPAAVAAVSALTESLGPEREAVVAVGVCATSATVVALDGAGEPVTAALTYADQRAVAEADTAQEAAAGRWTRLGLRVQPSFGLPKWAWLLRQPGVVAATERLAHASDVVVDHLVGEPSATDWSHALKSGYDPQRREWATEAMEALAIPAELLPDVRAPTEPVGTVGGAAAEATGLPRGCEVRLGMTDACASQLAAGADTPGQFVSVLGSTLVLKGASHDLVADPAGAVYSHRHPDGWWLPGGASSTGARALAAGFPDRDLADLDALAAEHGPARGVAYPLIGRGERFPFAAPDAEGFVLGELADEVERYRATLEGVAFVECLGYERLAALGAVATPPLSVSGGGSASRVWNRIRASVMGVAVVEKPAATTGLGACILAAAGTLHPDLSAATAAMAVTGTRVEPEEEDREPLQRNYERFLDAVTKRGWLPPK